MVLLREDGRHVRLNMLQLVPIHLVVYHHHKPMLDARYTQIRHYSRRELENERKEGKKKKTRIKKKKRKEKEAESMESERGEKGLKRERIWAS